jgi:bla regulator protein blaR1
MILRIPVVFAAVLSAQSFDVASIKPDSPGGVSTGDFRLLPGGRLSAEKVVLRFFIQNAYGLKPFQLSGGPDWISSQGYDIEAKAEGNPSNAQMQKMMQTLLEDRFKLKYHRETKEMPVYTLAVAKGGLKLPDPKDGSDRATIRISRMTGVLLTGEKLTIAELTRVLSNLLKRTVIDKTGFTGTFAAHLSFALDDTLAGLPHFPDAPDDPSIPSVFVAIEEQLGLKLESTKGPVEILVIDHIERPTAN